MKMCVTKSYLLRMRNSRSRSVVRAATRTVLYSEQNVHYFKGFLGPRIFLESVRERNILLK